MYARTLRAVGYRAITAANSLAACQIAVTHRLDVVVTDVRLAGSINGLELTRRLRTSVRTAAVRIIVLTTVSRPQDADVALKAGADIFLEKPVPGALLKAEIARLVPAHPREWPPTVAQHRPANLIDPVDLGGTSPVAPIPSPSTCPCCDAIVVYRERWPVITAGSVRPRIGGERLRYVSGWFCMNPACDYRLAREQT